MSINTIKKKGQKTKKLLNLDDLRPCHLYTSRSLSVLDDRIESIKKFLRGKINFDTDFKFFYGEEEIDEKEFINFVTTPSFFSKKKVAIIKNIEKVPSSILKMITGYLSKLDRKNFDTIFIITSLKEKLNFEFLGIVRKIGVIKKLQMPMASSLKKWLDERSELDGIKFTSSAAGVLIENVNFDKSLLAVEYEKLHTYIISEKERVINDKIVKRLVNRVYSMKIFDLVDYIGKRDKNNAIRALKYIISEGQSLLGLIVLIHRMFKAFLYIKFDGSRQEVKDYIYNNISGPPFFINKIINKYIRYSKNYTEAEIARIFNILNDFDINFRKGDTKNINLVKKLITQIIIGSGSLL